MDTTRAAAEPHAELALAKETLTDLDAGHEADGGARGGVEVRLAGMRLPQTLLACTLTAVPVWRPQL